MDSHWPVCSAHFSEDNLISPMRIMRNGDDYLSVWQTSRGENEEWNLNCSRDRIQCCGSQESTSKDVVDLLPSDPFGMDIKTTFTAITGWLEDLEGNWGNNYKASQEDYGLFAGWNLGWSNALKFQPYSSNAIFNEKQNRGKHSSLSNIQIDEKSNLGISNQFNEKLNADSKLNQFGERRDIGGSLAPYDFEEIEPACSSGDIVGSSTIELEEKEECVPNSEGEPPHEAFVLALEVLRVRDHFLGVKDLLTVERVCSSLCSTVRGDPLLWKSIHIDRPLNERITDDVLVQLASRAQGNLKCLSLVECSRVTDDGLRRVLETNPRITKLSVPGCTRLSIEGILNNIKTYNCKKDVLGLKHLRIGGVYGVTREHIEGLKLLLGAHDVQKLDKSYQKPYFYHRGNLYLPHDDNRAIDIEMCPRCEKFRLVYDCPAEGCRVKDDNAVSAQVCRACTLCVARCAECGTCINDDEYEETFCLELLCSDCFKEVRPR